MSSDNTFPYECRVYENGALEPVTRELTIEEPLRIVVSGTLAATLMRTPGDEEELVLGFLLTAGIIKNVGQVEAISFPTANEALVNPASGVEISSLPARHGPEMVADEISRFEKPAGRLDGKDVFQLAATMQSGQAIFRRTGGTHAAAIAEIPVLPDSGNVIVREDIGRHNALDKVIGAAAKRGIVFERSLLLLSGRLSFEMVAKSAYAGISDMVGVSAPSGLGVKLAQHLGMFLAGFARGEKMTVYVGHEALREGTQ